MGIYTIVNHENWLVDSTVLESWNALTERPPDPGGIFWDGRSPPVSISRMMDMNSDIDWLVTINQWDIKGYEWLMMVNSC